MPREKFQDANGLAAIAKTLRETTIPTAAASQVPSPRVQPTKQATGRPVANQLTSRPSKRLHGDTLHTNAATIDSAADVNGSSDSSCQDNSSSMEACDRSNNSNSSSSSQDASAECDSSPMHGTRRSISPTADTVSADRDTGEFRQLYLNSFTDAFADELQAFREADSDKHTVPTDLVVDAINGTADNIPLSQQRAWLQDAGPEMPLMGISEFEADWL